MYQYFESQTMKIFKMLHTERGAMTWETLSDELKTTTSVDEFWKQFKTTLCKAAKCTFVFKTESTLMTIYLK